MNEHDKLREAIAWARTYVSGGTSAGYMNQMSVLIAAAESTLPKTKMVEVWRVEYVHKLTHTDEFKGWLKGEWKACADTFATRELADAAAALWRDSRDEVPSACIRVTGPHQQEVPE